MTQQFNENGIMKKFEEETVTKIVISKGKLRRMEITHYLASDDFVTDNNDLSIHYQNMNTKFFIIPDHGYTHGGIFHADDVLSAGLLRYLNPDIKFTRGFQPPQQDLDTIVFDIGEGSFDHHQSDTELRPNGERYASIGLLWKQYGPMILSSKGVNNIDENIISIIDHCDNTSDNNPLSMIISSFNSNWDETANNDEKFEEVVRIATTMLSALINREISSEKALEIAKKALDNEFHITGPYVTEANQNEVVVLQDFAPIKSEIIHEKLALIYPGRTPGSWNLELLISNKRDKNLSYPEEWLGTIGNEAGTKQQGMTFCHKGNWLATFDCIEDAILCYTDLFYQQMTN